MTPSRSPSPYAELLGLDSLKEGPQEASFALAGPLRGAGRAFTADTILEGDLGMPFLKDVVVSLDLVAGRLRIARPPPAAAAPQP